MLLPSSSADPSSEHSSNLQSGSLACRLKNDTHTDYLIKKIICRFIICVSPDFSAQYRSLTTWLEAKKTVAEPLCPDVLIRGAEMKVINVGISPGCGFVVRYASGKNDLFLSRKVLKRVSNQLARIQLQFRK